MTDTIIVDYGMGNVGSICNMLKYIGHHSTISSDPATIRQASRLILAGVGAFDAGMTQLNRLGLTELLTEQVAERKVPVLGICLGMQLLTRSSEEGQLPGLGWIEADTKRFFFPNNLDLKIPHMGWNKVIRETPSPLTEGLDNESRFYFVHSYHCVLDEPSRAILSVDYGLRVTAAFQKENVLGVQFHPEKSHRFGMQILRNFVSPGAFS